MSKIYNYTNAGDMREAGIEGYTISNYRIQIKEITSLINKSPILYILTLLDKEISVNTYNQRFFSTFIFYPFNSGYLSHFSNDSKFVLWEECRSVLKTLDFPDMSDIYLIIWDTEYLNNLCCRMVEGSSLYWMFRKHNLFSDKISLFELFDNKYFFFSEERFRELYNGYEFNFALRMTMSVINKIHYRQFQKYVWHEIAENSFGQKIDIDIIKNIENSFCPPNIKRKK